MATTEAKKGPLKAFSVKEVPSYFGSAAVDHAVAGMCGSAVSATFLNPLDLVKVRWQVSAQASTSSASLMRLPGQILREWRLIVSEGSWKGLYRGLAPNMTANMASWGLYFFAYVSVRFCPPPAKASS